MNSIEAVPVASVPPPRDIGRAALEGIVFILGNEIFTLFDLRASHTFIFLNIVKTLN